MIQDLITNTWSSSLAASLVDHERDWEALLKDAGNTMTKAALHAFLHSPLSQIADQVNPLSRSLAYPAYHVIVQYAAHVVIRDHAGGRHSADRRKHALFCI